MTTHTVEKLDLTIEQLMARGRAERSLAFRDAFVKLASLWRMPSGSAAMTRVTAQPCS